MQIEHCTDRFEDLPDISLMAKIKAGQQDAFTALIRRHQQALLNFFRRLGAYNHAEDLVQETFLRLFKYRRRYRPSAKFTTFLYTLARHVWADYLRKLMRYEKAMATMIEEATAVADCPPSRPDIRRDVQIAVEHLSEKLRMVVVLSIYQGLNYREIADVLHIPEGTVKSRMFLALQQLKETLLSENKG